MEEHEAVSNGFPTIMLSEPKSLGEKRRGDDLDGRCGFLRERQHLDSPSKSEITNLDSKAIRNKEFDEHPKFTGEDMSRLCEDSQILDTESFEANNKNKDSDSDAKISLRQLDLNTDVCLASDSALNDPKSQLWPNKHDNNQKGIRLELDLNADAASSSMIDDSLCGIKKHSNSWKTRDVFSEEKDPMKVWKEMKQNGFLSAASSCMVSFSHGGLPAPRKRGRITKNDLMKKKMELAKREEVDRFAKIAAPSGLLNDLNPGIINHVRNKKQVLSIIQNLIKSEKDSRSSPGTQMKNRDKPGFSEDAQRSPDCNQIYKYSAFVDRCGNGESSFVHRIKLEDDSLSLKLSSFPKDESADFTSDRVLTVQAATVASQWLELLHQDIKGRLSALRRRKKRVRAVISTELPFLIHKEFSSAPDNDSNATTDGFTNIANAEMHKARWTTLFDHLDKILSDEEKKLESRLDQVKGLRKHCDQGLQHLGWTPSLNLLQLGVEGTDLRARQAVSSETEIAVQAAAASIYSTCNFLRSEENITHS